MSRGRHSVRAVQSRNGQNSRIDTRTIQRWSVTGGGHAECQVYGWGNAVAPSSGTYTVDGWPPSGTGKKDQAWPGTAKSPSTQSWSYSGRGSTVVSVIDVDTLLAHAMDNGDTAQAQEGFHFKL